MDGLSPLKAKPLRNPGQSLDEQIQAILDDKLASYLWFAGGFLILALMEWVGYVLKTPRQPWVYTIAALICVCWSAWRFFPIRRQVRALRQGRDGEKAVGQFLEGLRESGVRIFHDIPGDGFNLDHVVISQHGIFVIETKTWTKPYPNARVTFDGEQIAVAGRVPDRDPVTQVRAQVDWLARILEDSTGKRFPIKGAVVFPGWFVEPPPKGAKSDLWVLEPKALPAFIENEPLTIRAEDVSMAAFHLSRFIRAKP